MTPYAALLDRIRRDPAAPLLTYRDLASGERMELSAVSLGNAVAKTAGLLRDEIDASPGDVIGIHLPQHWQRIVWFGACAATGTIFAAGSPPQECDVLVVDRAHLGLVGRAQDTVLVSLAPFGLPDGGEIPTGVIEAAVAMRGHPDAFTPWETPTDGTPLLRDGDGGITHGQVMDQAARELSRRGVEAGQRFALIAPDPLADILGLAGPLISGGSAVLLAHPEAGDVRRTLIEEGVAPGGG
ncbi:MAG: hypothetical protein RL134_1892 [Actinomycetota bacterium]|jgi:uncharacterized protein (TIGR03089 family)